MFLSSINILILCLTFIKRYKTDNIKCLKPNNSTYFMYSIFSYIPIE